MEAYIPVLTNMPKQINSIHILIFFVINLFIFLFHIHILNLN